MNIKSEGNFDLGKTVVNKAAESVIASQITSAKNIEVNIDSQASSLVQGQVESVEIACEKI